MNFKIGDKVRIKDNLKSIEDFAGGYVRDLEKLVGKVCTIESIDGKEVYLKESSWTWDTRALDKAQFTKSDLKDGDIVTYRNGEKRTLKGKRFIDEEGEIAHRLDCYTNELKSKDRSNVNLDIIKVERPVQYEMVYERKEEVLDEAEKKYLRDVIRPFRKEIEYIQKIKSVAYEDKAYICIALKDTQRINFPYFQEETMYKGMKEDKEYTLEELRTIKLL